MSADRDTVLFHIVDYLKRTRDEDSAHSVEYSTAIAALESTIPSAADNFKKAAFCPHVNLETVFQSGQDALKLKSFASTLETAQANPKFDPFLELVTSKGYFEGSEPGSIEYLEKQSKVLLKFQQKSAVPTKEELELKAEEVKLAGNAAINAKDYAKAVELYSEALQLSPEGPNSHVYYSNRAAAYCSLQKYQESVDDCTQAIVLSPDFVRAHSRLGLSYFFLRQYEESVEAYERALEIEPDNKQTQDSLKSAKNKLRKSRAAADGSAVSSSSSGAGDGAMPDLSSLAGMMGGAGGMPDMSGLLANPKMKDAFDKAGGAAGISNIMKDPNFAQMAQNMMKNPQMMQQAMAMMGGAGGAGAGGMPDMSALMSMMGGAGGAPPSSSAGSSSSGSGSSSSGAKKPFKGFED